VTVAGKIGIRCHVMESFLVGIEQVKYTVSRLPYHGGSPRIYHLLRIGPYGASHGVFDFTTQKEMAMAGLILVRPPCFTDHHKQLSEHVCELVNDFQNAESTIDSKLDGEEAEADTAMCTPKRLVEGQDGTDLDTKPQALFDTPTQVLVGAKHILEEIDMAEFPMLAQLNIKLSTDYYLRALQRELEKLSDVIESIDLKNFVSLNDKVQTRILVARSLSWKSFAASIKRTKWFYKAADSVLRKLDENEEEEELDLDGKEPPNQSDVYEWMLHTLGDHDPEAFLRAAHKLGVPVALSKLTPQ